MAESEGRVRSDSRALVARDREQRIFLNVVRPAAAVLSVLVLGGVWLATGAQMALNIMYVAVVGAAASAGYVLAARIWNSVRVLSAVPIFDTLLVAALPAVSERPLELTLVYFWPIAIATFLAGARVMVVTVVLSGLAAVLVPLSVGDVEPAAVAIQALVVVFVGALLAVAANGMRAARREAATATEQLEQANELKSEFLAMASHELRTPLTAISGFSSTMINMGSQLSEEDRRTFLLIIEQQSNRLGRIVSDLLTLSSIESGKLHAKLQPVNVASAIEETIREADAHVVERGDPRA